MCNYSVSYFEVINMYDFVLQTLHQEMDANVISILQRSITDVFNDYCSQMFIT